MDKRYILEKLDDLPTVRCPCGEVHRAFLNDPDQTASVHLLSIREDSKIHYHKKGTEIYIILDGNGYLELDGDQIPVQPFTSVMIKPGCRNRAVGKLTIINIPIPSFDPKDEWFD